MKKVLTVIVLFTLFFISCEDKIPTNDNDYNTIQKKDTTLEIKNRSSYDLLQVNFGGTDFGTIISGNQISKKVEAGTRRIFFYLKSHNGNVYCRTDDVMTCRAEENNEWVFIDNTFIENIDDETYGILSSIFNDVNITFSSLELTLNGNKINQSEVYDFGFLVIGRKSEVTFNIKSAGQENLIIGIGSGDLVYLENNPQEAFSVTQPALSTVPPGSSTSFKVIFSPKAIGTNLNAVVHIKNNSRDNSDFFFTVKGNGRNYLVGDVGPAGGYIYYDKGSISEGWRYLEAAPASAEFTAQWGASNVDVNIFSLNNLTEEDYLILPWMTLSTIGTGKDNTNLIIVILNQRGETNCAAQRCKSLILGGYNDWFLPSADDFIYIDHGLRREGLGGFGSGDYWSSSQSDSSSAKSFNFDTYKENIRSKSSALKVRAVRSF